MFKTLQRYTAFQRMWLPRAVILYIWRVWLLLTDNAEEIRSNLESHTPVNKLNATLVVTRMDFGKLRTEPPVYRLPVIMASVENRSKWSSNDSRQKKKAPWRHHLIIFFASFTKIADWCNKWIRPPDYVSYNRIASSYFKLEGQLN
jgi:hypothetical protein